MPKIYFETHNGLLMINGVLFEEKYLNATNNTSYALIYSSSNEDCFPIMTKLTVHNNRLLSNNRLAITECGNDIFSVKFGNISYSSLLPPKPYFQSYIKANRSHYLTAYEQGSYYVAIETESEIITLDCPKKLDNIRMKSTQCGGGNLLIISGEYDQRKYIAIVEYTDDYELIFQADCDNFNFLADKIVITDHVADMLGRTITRDFAYTQGKYVELTRRFEYTQSPHINAELLPYAFLEALHSQDYGCCDNYLCDNLRSRDMKKFFGDYTCIFSRPYLPYAPYQVGLSNNSPLINRIKYFDFIVDDGLIVDISPV